MRRSALATLSWLVDAGVDVLVEAEPRNWLETPLATHAPASPAPASPAPTPRADGTTTEPVPPGPPETPSVPRVPAPASEAEALAAAASTLEELAAAVASFHGATRDRPAPALFADGNPASGVMVIGDAPSSADAALGRPFADEAGQLLDRMLAAVGLDRSTAYLTTLVSRPSPSGGAPRDAEVAAWLPLARRHIELVRPSRLLLLGGCAASALTGRKEGLNRLRGEWLEIEAGGWRVPAVATYTPAYLLRQPAHKRHAWADLKLFSGMLP